MQTWASFRRDLTWPICLSAEYNLLSRSNVPLTLAINSMTQRSSAVTEMLSLSRCALGQTQNTQSESFQLIRSGMCYVTMYGIKEYPVQPLGQLDHKYGQYDN